MEIIVKPLRILIADDHDLMRRGVKTLIESHTGWEVCGEATTGREAVAKVEELEPDVLILDISMPDLNGVEAASCCSGLLPYFFYEFGHVIDFFDRHHMKLGIILFCDRKRQSQRMKGLLRSVICMQDFAEHGLSSALLGFCR